LSCSGQLKTGTEKSHLGNRRNLRSHTFPKPKQKTGTEKSYLGNPRNMWSHTFPKPKQK
jgi:hypothetical protein